MSRKRKVVSLNIEGKEIKRYGSISEASKDIKTHGSNIIKAANSGQTKTVRGFYWRYVR